MSTTAQEYNRDGDKTAQPAPLAFWDPVSEKTYMFEIDPADPAIPVSGALTITPSPILITRNGVDQEVTLDTAAPANNRPLPTVQLAGDSLAPVAVGVGISNSQTMRVHVGNGTSIDVNVTNTVLDVRIGDSAGNGLTSTNVGGKQSLDTNVTQSALPIGASTAALQTTGNTSLSSIDTKLISQATAALQTTGNASLASIDGKTAALVGGKVPVDTSGTVFTSNSTTTPLAANGTFTGTAEDTLGYGTITVQAFSNVASATDGLLIEWSTNGTNWDDSDPFTVAAGNGRFFTFGPQARFFRLVYTNGATIQTTFRLQTIGKPGYVKPSSHRLTDTITDDSDAELQKAVLTGRTSGGAYVNVQSSTGGALSVAGNEYAASNYGAPAATTTQRVAAMLGVGTAAVSATNPVPMSSVGGASVQLASATVHPYFQDFTLSSLSTTYTQVIASTGAAINAFSAVNNSATPIYVSTGAAASEVVRYIVMPGETTGRQVLQIAAGTRVAIRTVTGTEASGKFSLNVFTI